MTPEDEYTPEKVQEMIRLERICMAETRLRAARSRLQELQVEVASEIEKIRVCMNDLVELGAPLPEM